MHIEDKIAAMEKQKGNNHPLPAMRALLDEHLPAHKNLEKIQVAGTNGKGSTTLWMAKILAKSGFRVGVFTSPHLQKHFERICINENPIEPADWERIYDRWRSLFKKERFTMFEMDLWMALDYFLEQDVDVAIMECGLGGRKDATTALDYKATLITSIGMDHMEYLGNTKAAIAREKAGIFKPGIPAFTAENDQGILRILAQQARMKGTNLYHTRLQAGRKEYTLFIEFGSRYLRYDLLRLPQYQLPNLALAIQTLKALEYPMDYEDVQAVIDAFVWPGRYHQISAEPYILVDGAHNLQGVENLVDSLGVFNGEIFFSCLADKQARAMIAKLKSLDCPLYLVRFQAERAANLKQLAKQEGLPVIEFKDMMKNLKTRNKAALVCGSLYFAADVLKDWEKR